MSDTRPYRGYVFISEAKSTVLKILLSTIEPGTMAPTNTWTNAHKRSVQAIKDRPNLFTVDGMRSNHVLLTYGKYKKVTGGPSFDEWILMRQDTLRWLEAGVTEIIQVTSHNNRAPVKNSGGPHEAGITIA